MELKSYKWNAQDYAKHSSGQFEWAQELIAKLDLQGSESILDIGCGDGKITHQLAEAAKNGYVLGIDQSEEMIRMALEQFPPRKIPQPVFLTYERNGYSSPSEIRCRIFKRYPALGGGPSRGASRRS